MQEFINGKLLFKNKFIIKNFLVKDGVLYFNYKKTSNPIDISNMIVTPGFVDVHVHTRTPGYENKETIETITDAALAGGFTTLLAMANVLPIPTNLDLLDPIIELIQKSKINIFQCGGVTNTNKIANILEMSKKTKFFSDDGLPIENEELMKQALILTKQAKATLFLHEQTPGISGIAYKSRIAKVNKWESFDNRYEYQIIKRDIDLNKDINARIHLQHLSTAMSIKLFEEAKIHKMPISAELTPHHLYFNNTMIENHGYYRMNPPINSRHNQLALIGAFKKNIINIIATDHAPHLEIEKNVPYDKSINGVIGLESAFAVTNTILQKHNIPIEQILRAFTYNPAQILNIDIEPKNKRKVNLVIIDPYKKWIFEKSNIKSKSSNSPFIGQKLIGQVKQVLFSK